MKRRNDAELPLYFGPGGELFGLFHPGLERAVATNRVSGVLLCPPLGQDQIRCHRLYRQLAYALAADGVPTLRFDYYGTGDSAGAGGDVDWERCMADVVTAASELRMRSGVDRVVAFGARLGGTLAMAATSTARFADIVAWDPVLDGGAHAAQLDAMQAELGRDSRRFTRPRAAADTAAQWLGFSISDRLRQQITALRFALPASALLVLDSLAPASSQKWGQKWGQFAAPQVTVRQLELPTPWDELPRLEIAILSHPLIQLVIERLRAGPAAAARAVGVTPVNPAAGAFAERALRFGRAMHLVGIAGLPESTKAAAENVGVIVLNAGLVHRIGPFRLHVDMTRRLNASGYPTLRFDMSTIGDSAASGESQSRRQQIHADVTDAISLLGEQARCSRFVVIGLCSGAQNAHQVACSVSSIVGAVFLDGYAYRTFGHHLRNYLPRLLQAKLWKRVFTGRHGSSMQGNDAQNNEPIFSVTPLPQATVRADFAGMLDRGLKLCLIYSGGISTYFNHVRQFRECFGRVVDHPNVSTSYLAGCDHTYVLTGDRKRLIDDIERWLSHHFPTALGAYSWKQSSSPAAPVTSAVTSSSSWWRGANGSSS